MGPGGGATQALKPAFPAAWERALLYLAAFACPLLLWVEWSLRPGWASVDEDAQLALIQALLDGAAPHWRFAGSAIHRWALAGAAWLGGLEGIRLATLLWLVAENTLLFKVAARWGGPRAGRWAVMANLLASFFIIRGRSPLGFVAVPLYVLAFLFLLEHLKRPHHFFLWGLGAALLLFDYEGWALALPGLLLALSFEKKFPAPRHGWALAGVALGGALVWACSLPFLESHALVRGSQSLRGGVIPHLAALLENARALVLGGESLPYVAASHYPALPWWWWPALLPGLALWIVHRPWAVAALALGLAPLALAGQQVMTHRLVAAWPYLCLGVGTGAAWMGRRERTGPFLLAGLALLACLGAFFEWRAVAASMREGHPRFYAESENALDALAWIKSQDGGKPRGVLLQLGSRDMGALRLAGYPPPGPKGSAHWALAPWAYSPALDRQGVPVRAFRRFKDEPPVLVYARSDLPASQWRQMEGVQERLESFVSRDPFDLPLGLRRRAALALRFERDPWVRTALWEWRLRGAWQAGVARPDEVAAAMDEDLRSADLWLNQALRVQSLKPGEAESLVDRALALDPRRRLAWDMKLEMVRAKNDPEALRALQERLQALDPSHTWNPQWLWY